MVFNQSLGPGSAAMVYTNNIMKHYSFPLRIIILFALIALSACGLTPTLVPAVGFVKGSSEIPPGQYLFVEYASSMSCHDPSYCPCPAPGPVRPSYEYSSGILHLALLDDRQLDADWTAQDLPANTAGFLGYGEYNSHIYSITSFRYESPDKNIVIYSVDSQGKIAAQVSGETYFFKPGQSWVKSGRASQRLPLGCYYEYTSRVTNYGFLTKDQIKNDG